MSEHSFKLFAGVTNNILKTNERFTVPVTTAEFAVMRAAFNVCLLSQLSLLINSDLI